MSVKPGQGQDLEKAEGSSFLQGTPVGDAAVAWTTAYDEWRSCEQRASHVGLRERLQLHRRADRAAERIGPLRDAFDAVAAPERARLKAELPEARKTLDELYGPYAGQCTSRSPTPRRCAAWTVSTP